MSPFVFNNPFTEQLLRTTGNTKGIVILVNFVGAIVFIVVGIAMLKGKRWGRQLSTKNIK